MAALNLYATNSLASVYTQLSETDPGAEAYASPVAGWIVSTGSTNRSEWRPGVERAATTFDSTSYPDGTLDTTNGDGFRSASAYTGTFDAGNWTFYFGCRANTSGTGQDVRGYYRVFRSTNANGASATEITSGTVTCSDITNLATSATQVTSASFNPGSVSLAGEYLFVQFALGRFGAASMSSADVNMRIGNASGSGTRLVTPNFTYTYTLTVQNGALSISSGNVTVTPFEVLADAAITLNPSSGYSFWDVDSVAQINNWRYLGYGYAIEVADQLLYVNSAASVDTDGLVSGAASVEWYWYDDDTELWSGPYTWTSEELVVASCALSITCSSTFFPGGSVATTTITVQPGGGYQYHPVTDIAEIADTGTIYYGLGVTVGCQALVPTLTDNGFPLTIDSQGFFEIDSNGDAAPDSFTVQFYDVADGTWGTEATIDVVAGITVADGSLSISAGTPTLTQHNVLAPANGALTIASSEPAITFVGNLVVQSGSLSITSSQPTVTIPEDADPDALENVVVEMIGDVFITAIHDMFENEDL